MVRYLRLDYVMPANVFIIQLLLATLPTVFSTELLPERYLKPQDFNHHPFTDVGIPAALKKVLKSTNQYAILSKKRPREGREFPPQNVVIYPTPHDSVLSSKHIETNEIGKFDDGFVNAPKNYAFSYIVKDQHSGDDFSHSQAHNGKATKGEYRVKLPDGRTQIVSYTADHKGYRADVQYEQDFIQKPLTKTFIPNPEASLKLSNHYHVSPKPATGILYTITASPSKYLPSTTAATPVQYVADYVSTTSAPYVQQQYVTSTAAPQYVAQASSTPLHPVLNTAGNAVYPGYQEGHYQNYQVISSTASPDHAVIVTPRPLYNRGIRKTEQQSAPLYYRLLKR